MAKISDQPTFEISEHLKTKEDAATYLTLLLREKNSAEFVNALGVLARCHGMSDVASASGLTREALYKALRRGSYPRFDTIHRVCAALGVHLVAQPKHS